MHSIRVCYLYRVKKSWIRKKFHNKILSGKRKLKYGSPLDEFFWPESALTGKLTIEDKEEAQKEYEKIFPGNNNYYVYGPSYVLTS